MHASICHVTILSLACGLWGPSVGAQSFNIDIDTASPSGAGDGAPTSAFGAAARQPGAWNIFEVQANTMIVLADLAGSATTVTLTRSSPLAGNGNFSFDHPDTAGDVERLMDDLYDLSDAGGATLTFSNLQPGEYAVYTYAWAPDQTADLTTVTVSGSPSPNPQTVGGGPGSAFVLGGNYAMHMVDVTIAGTLTVFVDGANASQVGSLNGMQIMRLSPCPADIVTSGGSAGVVNIDDLLAVISAWGPCPAPPASCPANIVNSGGSVGVVDIDDLLAVISAWGPCL